MAESTENNKPQPKTGNFWKELLSGSMVSEKLILKNLGYISLVTILAALYIMNRFHAEKITREMTKIQKEVRDLRSESLSTSSDLMEASRQSQVVRLIKEKGLHLEELKTPAYKLLVDK